MSNKLIALKLNERFGILQAQTVEFTTDPNKLIRVKGGVGVGKSSVNNAVAIGLSAGSARELPLDMKTYEDVNVEDQLTVGDIPLFMHTTFKAGTSTSTVYMKDKNGNKIKNPTINGRMFTPASLRDYLKTELTFSIEDFISENPRIQNQWMMKVYKEKLREKGVIFDKTSSDYQDSVLYRLEQAKADRDRKYNKVTEFNAYKKRLEEEGNSEKNIPEEIDIKVLETKHKEAIKIYYEKLADIDRQIAGIKLEASKCNSIIDNYNNSLETQKELVDTKLGAVIDEYNKNVDEEIILRDNISDAIRFLIAHGFIGLQKQFDALPKIKEKKIFIPSTIEKIKKDNKGRYINDGNSCSPKVDKAFCTISSFRDKAMSLFTEKKNIIEPDDSYLKAIDAAKTSNRIAVRWATFYEHQAADMKVNKIWNEYKKIFTSIDLGVDGLKMMVLNESDEIRTMYNGVHDTVLFHNKKKEFRVISSYSMTQRNILAILMQIYLLEEKKKNGEEGLRYLFIDVPIDIKTKDLLISMQKKYDLQLVTTCTGDFDQKKLVDGEVLIQDGYLLSNKIRKKKK